MKNVAIAPQASGLDAVTPLEERDRALLALAHDCGLSAEEIARLDVDSVDFQRDTLRITSRRVEELPAPPVTLRQVARYLEHARSVLQAAEPGAREPDALFLSKTGRRMAGSDVRRRLAAVDSRIESARVRSAYQRSHPRA
jgi:site-specific recombinase XerC